MYDARPPRMSLSAAASFESTSSPSSSTAPPVMSPGGDCTSASSESAVTDFPLPDSPTSPRHSPFRTANETESTARYVSRGCSVAYMSAGLYWAERNYALAAVTNSFRTFKQSGSIEDIDPSLLNQWFICELQLGRVPYALSAYELGAMVRNGQSRTQEQIALAEEHRIEQGHWLAAMMIATEFKDLPRLRKLPAALDRLGLLQVSTALLFLMGGEHALRAGAAIPNEETPEGIAKLFDDMTATGRSAELPKPDYMLNHSVRLRSRVLGCEITAACENTLTSLGVAEALLGTLESLLATSLCFHMHPNLDRLTVRVQSKSGADLIPTLEFVEESGSTVAVVTPRPVFDLRHSRRSSRISALAAGGRRNALPDVRRPGECRTVGQHHSWQRKRRLSRNHVFQRSNHAGHPIR
jgi:hypothetical protein